MVEGADTNLIGTELIKNLELNLNFDKTQTQYPWCQEKEIFKLAAMT